MNERMDQVLCLSETKIKLLGIQSHLNCASSSTYNKQTIAYHNVLNAPLRLPVII